MMDYSLLEVASLVVYVFGALTFSLLAGFYWSERRRSKRSVFPIFTLVCAAAFLSNLLFHVLALRGGLPAVLITSVLAGLIPPLILHVVYEAEAVESLVWRAALIGVYIGSTGASVLRSLNIAAEYLYRAPAVSLAVATAVGLAVQIFSRHSLTQRERAHRSAIRVLLLLMLACATASLAGWGAFLFDAPDYLLLAFFGVSLYYRERLVFFDLLVKRGAFLAVGLAILAGGFAMRQRVEWNPWSYALGLPLFWLAGPWVYDFVARAIDHTWLRRPYSSAEAERQFIRLIRR
jgi:hypothetical protein